MPPLKFSKLLLKNYKILLQSSGNLAQLLFITQIYYVRLVCPPPFLLPVNKLTLSLTNSLLVIYFQTLSTCVFKL